MVQREDLQDAPVPGIPAAAAIRYSPLARVGLNLPNLITLDGSWRCRSRSG